MPATRPPLVPLSRLSLSPSQRQKCFNCIAREARRLASAAAAVAPEAPHDPTVVFDQPIQRHPPKQPPSYRSPDLRSSQLIRQYTSLLRSTPLFLIFQHNNLRGTEWASIRRELDTALRRVSAKQREDAAARGLTEDQMPPDLSQSIRLQVISTTMLSVALRIVEFYNPSAQSSPSTEDGSVPPSEQLSARPVHSLSQEAYDAGYVLSKDGSKEKLNTPLHNLLCGPVALLTFPSVSPEYLSAALKILTPTPGSSSPFAAPKRRDQPTYYESAVQNGLPKLMLLGAKVDGKMMDTEGVKWVGGIQGGIDGLRSQLVSMLQNAGMGLTSVLGGASNALYGVMQSRKMDMEENGAEKGEKVEKSEG